MVSYPRVASFRTSRDLAEYLATLGCPLPIDEAILPSPSSPLSQPVEIPWGDGKCRVGNRFAVQPMEGWDGEPDGRPSELTRRRWLNFGRSGAKLIWGGEAVAVLPEARANPHQLILNDRTAPALAALREETLRVHHERFGRVDDLIFGLQLTHSGRYSRPRVKDHPEPLIVYHHPVLDTRCQAGAELHPISDAEIERIVSAFGAAARLAREIGFDFVDLKHCHGYLGHEFLSAHDRSGQYGGCFANRTRFLQELVAAVRSSAKGLEIGVRVSAYDSVPFVPDPESKRGMPVSAAVPYHWGFGVNPNEPTQPDLSEAKCLLALLGALGVRLINVSAGSPYYSPHIQRPALFPPLDAYLPPEDPLAGSARLQWAARELKSTGAVIVSSGWSYFQNYLPQVAQALVRDGWTDFVGLGRVTLSYPDLPADVLAGGFLDAKRLCRTFSDCTTAPRNGLVSGCYPLDPFYKARHEATLLREIKQNRAVYGAKEGEDAP
jgi:2,4-dienoyl-CoA reductase-like NADH-dependent reductase (Old Yellow Enzyme family)